ncbi:MAG: 16S rRNA (cytidine(1402)-2'-O)-methyltransferase [Bacteroidota bacterium]
MLYIVPTPIGNLADITLRALEILQSVDLILAEDTRTSKKLLDHYKIETPMRAFHAHNEHKVLQQIVEQLKVGTNIALISDAGTPSISDPGFLLARACQSNEITLTCLPGATAFVPALVMSGLPSDKFYFEGFLPHKKGRQTRLKYLAMLPCTFILYESPYRLVKCLKQLIEHCGSDRRVAVCREISKKFESIQTGTLEEVAQFYEQQSVKGEIVIVVAGLTD